MPLYPLLFVCDKLIIIKGAQWYGVKYNTSWSIDIETKIIDLEDYVALDRSDEEQDVFLQVQ